MLLETRKAQNSVVCQIVFGACLNSMSERRTVARNASRNSRSFGRKNILNVEGLIPFYPTLLLKYNIIVSETLNQNLLHKDICLNILSGGSVGHL